MPYRPNSHKPSNFPYTKHSSDSDAVADIGGATIEYTAGGNLNLGDAVYVSAADTVNKSIVAADIAKYVGVVVGGAKLANYVNTEKNKYGVIQAAATGERVIVQRAGIAYVITEAAYAATTNIVPSTTTAGRMLTNAAARGNGILLEASSGAGAVAKAIIF
jgi:hypothetical protein